MQSKSSIQLIHVLGHPGLPLDIKTYPQDSQVFTCWNFCSLLEFLKIPYFYYGITGSQLPGNLGAFVDLGMPTGIWRYRNAWHSAYTKRLVAALNDHLLPEGTPQLLASMYGAAQSDIGFYQWPVFEPMAGYGQCWTPYRVFPSYAQQHVIYTSQNDFTYNNRYFDTVIPHFLDPNDYHPSSSTGQYLLYLGRNVPEKGIALAQEAADACGLPLKKIYSGCYGEEKIRLLGEAVAVMTPTCYVEPFGYVAIEAQMCGTPVISSDWGAFVQTVLQGKTGFRCRTAAEFQRAITLAPTLNRDYIRRRAVRLYSIRSVAPAYASYFEFIWNVHTNGGYYAPNAFIDNSIKIWGEIDSDAENTEQNS